MLFRVGLENGIENHSIAWVLEHPGCFADGETPAAAVDNLPAAIRNYADWLAHHKAGSWIDTSHPDIQVEETWQCYYIDKDYERASEGYEVNAWFLHDWIALSAEEIERAVKLLAWSRADLLTTLRGLSQEVLHKKHPNERWDILGILRHVGGAEWWYLDRLGLAFPRDEVPMDPFERLDKVRAHLLKLLPDLVASTRVVGVDGEFWSPRKLLRRTAWHERDHTNHIQKLI